MNNSQRITSRRMRPSPARHVARQQQTTAQPAARSFHWERLLPVTFGLLILGIWWIAGARWTIDGSPLVLNAIADFLHMPIALPHVARWEWYAILCWLPVGISYMEHKHAPWRIAWKGAILIGIILLLVWLVVTGADWLSTFLALTQPEPNAWRLAHQVAAVPILAAVIATITTFVPEFGIALLIWWLWE